VRWHSVYLPPGIGGGPSVRCCTERSPDLPTSDSYPPRVARPTLETTATPSEEVIVLRARFNKFRALIYTGATLATFLLAAGARWKNN